MVHADLIRRLRALGVGHQWAFHSRKGTPVDLGNARRCYLHPAAAAIGVVIGGWHDFRQTLVRMMRRGGENPVVISGVVGHKSVEMAEVYDRASAADIGQALSLVGKQLQSPIETGRPQCFYCRGDIFAVHGFSGGGMVVRIRPLQP